MARISTQDCLKQIPNVFALCTIAAERAHQIARGAIPLVICDNKAAVTGLREIAAGKVGCRETVTDVLAKYSNEMKSLESDRKSTRRPNERARARAEDKAAR